MRIYGLGAVTAVDRRAHTADLKTDSGAAVRLSVLDHDLIRVTVLPEGDYRLKRTWWVVDESGDTQREGRDREDLSPFPLPDFAFTDNGTTLEISTKLLRVTVHRADLRIEWATTEGEVFAEDSRRRAYACNPSGSDLYHYMNCRPEDRYYGFGEVAGPLDKHGARIEMRGTDAIGYNAETGDPLYKHWPFYITLAPAQNIAYGLFYDNMSHLTFDMGRERHGYYGAYRYLQASNGDLEYYLIYGPSIAQVMAKFARLTGRMALPPRWSLGYLGSTMTYTEMPDAQEQLKRFVEDTQTHDIPCDLFHLSSGYTVNPATGRREVFTWNRSRIPDPGAMVDHFHAAGIRLSANIKPYVMPSNPHYEGVDAAGGFVRTPEGDRTLGWLTWAGSLYETAAAGHVDFTSEAGYRWWQRAATEQLLDYGIDSLWNDNNEYAVWDDDAQCDGFGQPVNLGKVRPVQHLLMVRASTEAQQAKHPTLRPFVLTRSACPGSQRYAQTWSGDNATSWHTLKYNIPMGLGFSLSGMANTGHDIGGFFGERPSPELLVRWVQNGIFHPRFTIHSLNSDGSATEPWMYPDVLPLIREAIHFRYRLIPYLYTAFVRAHHDGRPIIAPTVYHFQQDPNTHTQSFDFMLGDDLLVESVFDEGATTREVYLPDGVRWCDWHSGQWYEGGQTVTLDAPLERFPLLVREGGMIVMRESARAEHSRLLCVFPGENGVYRAAHVEDDGETLRYQHGEQTWLRFTLTCSPERLRLEIDIEGSYTLPYESMRVVLPENENRPLDIEVRGAALQVTR